MKGQIYRTHIETTKCNRKAANNQPRGTIATDKYGNKWRVVTLPHEGKTWQSYHPPEYREYEGCCGCCVL